MYLYLFIYLTNTDVRCKFSANLSLEQLLGMHLISLQRIYFAYIRGRLEEASRLQSKLMVPRFLSFDFGVSSKEEEHVLFLTSSESQKVTIINRSRPS